jgi:methionyl-tRNA formyltransferase
LKSQISNSLRLLFIGTGDIGLPTLRALLDSSHEVCAVVTQPDKPVGRHQELTASPIKQLALERHVPILQPKKIRLPDSVAQLRALSPDVIVVMAYGQILPADLLRIPSVACLNLHASILPRHRGAAPVHAAVEAGDRESGIAVMYMDEGLDTGPVLLERRLPIRRRETAGSLHDRLAALAPEALAEALRLLQTGQAPILPQDNTFATYAPKLTREHGEIDWTASRCAIDRKIRGMYPWPAAYTWLPAAQGPKKLKVYSAIIYRRITGPPGAVLRADRHGLLVAARDGAILIRDLQLEGKRRMTARDFLLGHPVPVGTLLGHPAG